MKALSLARYGNSWPQRVLWIGLAMLVLSFIDHPTVFAQSDDPNTNMATDPKGLVEAVTVPAFLPPDEYHQQLSEAAGKRIFSTGVAHLRQPGDIPDDPRSKIKAAEIKGYADTLVGFAEQSRRDGNILWGRIEGTKYEAAAHEWIFSKLKSFGIDNVQYDRFPTYESIWFPTANSLEVVSAPGFNRGQTFNVEGAITPFPSKTTPAGGLKAELVYVGDGTAAELAGRDLTGKIVMVRGRAESSALFSSVRIAYSRIATGEWGKPAGFIVWWQIPGVKQVAGRVGAPGGGDQLGEVMPWIGINDENGYYLRKLIDRAPPSDPVMVRMVVEGKNRLPSELQTGNVYAILPGKSGKYIMSFTHVDGYFYGLQDNGASVAANLALARHYAALPPEQREHGFIFLFEGGHERTGVGGTRNFAAKYPDLMKNDLLLISRMEHLGFTQQLKEGFLTGPTNIGSPYFLTLSNRSPLLLDLFKEAASEYGVSMADVYSTDFATDEIAFYPPFNDFGAPVFAGWLQTGPYYHTTADVDMNGISFAEMEKAARGMSFIFDQLGKHTVADLREGESPFPKDNGYSSPLFKLFLGNN
jgi:hypothetical protein